MRTLNIATLDLNLLLVFDAIAREGNIVRAADRLGMSQPAASHALARLRYALGDDLFIRTGRGMQPTAQARRLADHVRRALTELEVGLKATSFDAVSSEQHFSMAVDNYCAVVLAGPVLRAVAKAAPRVRLTLRPSGTMDIEQMMDNGELDLVLGGTDQPRDRFATEELFTDDFVVLRRATPGSTADPITVEQFASLPHLYLSSTRDDTGFVDRALEERGLKRSIAHCVPLLACAAVLEHYDALVVMRRAMAETFCARGALRICDLPFSSPLVPVCMRWHRHHDGEQAHTWFRRTCKTAARSISTVLALS